VADADMQEIARLEARELVAGSFLHDAPIIAVSSKTGEGLGELRDALLTAAAASKGRDESGPARLPIDRLLRPGSVSRHRHACVRTADDRG
jgi:selenocysteine-specific elongation factor